MFTANDERNDFNEMLYYLVEQIDLDWMYKSKIFYKKRLYI